MRLRVNLVMGGALFALAVVGGGSGAADRAHHPFMDANLMNREQPPGCGFWFGTDKQGRDIYSRVVHGARDLADGRGRLATDQYRDRHHAGTDRRLLGRLVGRLRQRPDERHARDPLADLRAGDYGGARARPDQPADCARPHQLVVHLPHCPRLGPVVEGAGLCSGRQDAWLQRHAHHADAAPSQHGRPDHRHRDARHGRRGPGRSRALLPRARRPAALAQLGQHAVGCARPDHHGAGLSAVSGPCHLLHGARPQSAGRRPARHARSPVEEPRA